MSIEELLCNMNQPFDMTERDLPLAVTTASAEETEALGAALGRALEADTSLPRYIAMYGDLGVGKTAFVRGLASVLAPGKAVKSPTFALVHEHRVHGKKPLFHFDLYRVESEDDLYSIGYDDYLDQGFCVCEWCEKIPYAIPSYHLEVRIKKDAQRVDDRHITVTKKTKEATAC